MILGGFHQTGRRLTLSKDGNEIHLSTTTGATNRYDTRTGERLNP